MAVRGRYDNGAGTLTFFESTTGTDLMKIDGPNAKVSMLNGAKFSNTLGKTLKGTGSNGAGPVTLTGAAVGDSVRKIIGNLTAGGPLLVFVPGTDFESTITVVNQIQQLSASDLHLTTIVVDLA